jgi:hypothetical protein
MFRKAISVITPKIKVARFYIPLCPRYYDTFNYNEFAAKLITECKRSDINDNDRQHIADNMFNLKKHDGKYIYEPVQFADLVYSKESYNLIPGLGVRSLIISLAVMMSTTGGIDFSMLTFAYMGGSVAFAIPIKSYRDASDDIRIYVNDIRGYVYRQENTKKYESEKEKRLKNLKEEALNELNFKNALIAELKN